MVKSAAMFFIFALPILHAGGEDCHYGDNPPIAVIGERLTLSCTLNDEICFTTEYKWFNITGNASLPEKSSTLVVSEMVQSVDEVGGHEYMCQCDSSTAVGCRLFKIGVKPKVQLYTSVPVARSGSTVNVTCKADSYPPANSEDKYHMKHPRDHDINAILLPEKNGVVHIITNASKEIDSGEYECTVIVELDEYSTPLQSDIVLTNLTVYDSPMILRTENFTLCDVGQSAVLECAVGGIGNSDMDVWVNWTNSKNRSVNESHIKLRRGNSFYLAIFNAIAGNYTCQVFSTYFPDKPEDTKIASILKTACFVSPKGELNKKTDDGNFTLVLVSALLSVVALIATATACGLGVCVWRLRQNSSKTGQHVKLKEPNVTSNNYTNVFQNNSPKACTSENVPKEPVSGSKQTNNPGPVEDAACESHIQSGSGSGTTSVEIEANRSDEGSQSAKAREQSQGKKQNQDQGPAESSSTEKKVSDREHSLEEKQEEQKEIDSSCSPTSSILSRFRSLSPPSKKNEERKKLVDGKDEDEETEEQKMTYYND